MALITAAQVISTAFTNSSFDEYMIKAQLIRSAEVQYIRPALGDELYALIVAEHTAGVYTLNNETLLEDYIQPALAYYVKLLVLPDLNVNTGSQGLMVNGSEFSTQATSSMRAELAQATKQIADSIISDMLKLITEDENDNYPTYNNGTNKTSKRSIGGFLISTNNDTTDRQYPWRKSQT
jgi:hypothetical protein